MISKIAVFTKVTLYSVFSSEFNYGPQGVNILISFDEQYNDKKLFNTLIMLCFLVISSLIFSVFFKNYWYEMPSMN